MPRWEALTPLERIQAKIDVMDGHWIWTGYSMQDGTGQVRIDGVNYTVHRCLWEAVSGPIPNGMYLRKTCGRLCCVKPEHFYLSETNTRAPADISDRFWQYVDKTGDCWLWTGSLRPNGYGQFGMGRKASPAKAHRTAWELASSETIPPGMDVGHTCDIRHCVRNDDVGTYAVNGVLLPRRGHLFLGTRKQNMEDAVAKDRHAHGEAHSASMRAVMGVRAGALTDADIVAIRNAAADGKTFRQIAQGYDVPPQTIWDIVHRKSWRHIP